ncbi:hypothetical protein [Streptomyces sp. NPDC057686]|uniref:hypothetical protein n=1 Tax=Streptomyces sp. NPDC057686 TaxID=3346212 RepID=UPI0036AE6F4E
MGDSAPWIAAITGGTAVLAGWVTGRHTARAAEYQADTNARVRRDEERRTARRAAYASLVEHTHALGGLYGETRVAMLLHDPTARAEALSELLARQRATYHQHFLPALRTVSLEGPDDVAAAAEAVQLASTRTYKTVGEITLGSAGADAFDPVTFAFWDRVDDFVLAGRRALEA